MGGSTEQRTRRGLRDRIENGFPHSEPLLLVVLPSSLDNKRAVADIGKLRRTILRVRDSDTTGLDSSAPAVWLVTRGMTFVLVVNGSWRQVVWSKRSLLNVYDVHDDDGSKVLNDWLRGVWPRISGFDPPCFLEKARSGEGNEELIDKVLSIPIMSSASGVPHWGAWNGKQARASRAIELSEKTRFAVGDHIKTRLPEELDGEGIPELQNLVERD